MRNLIFVILGLELLFAVFVTWSAITVESDPAGRGMAQGFAMVIVGACIVFGVPALGMALANRFLAAALVLALLPIIAIAALLG